MKRDLYLAPAQDSHPDHVFDDENWSHHDA